jgi:flagellar hook-associated protein 1 FlgK
VQQSTNQVDTTTALVNALQNQRQSVSGVNLDEEMTNLITFQRGYQASARALSAMDDMLDQLINRTGRVGL